MTAPKRWKKKHQRPPSLRTPWETNGYSEANQERRMAEKIKKIVNIWLRPDQEERI